MKHWQAGSVLMLLIALTFTGCAKKSAEQASITGTGFDSSSSTSSTDELAQLPQSQGASTAIQQAGVETLPVETSPVTQMAPMDSAATGSLTHEQQIQTALKNAGFYNGSIDGKIGPATKRAIVSFQEKNNLKADGKVGPKTWAALEAYMNGSAGPTADIQDSTANADQ